MGSPGIAHAADGTIITGTAVGNPDFKSASTCNVPVVACKPVLCVSGEGRSRQVMHDGMHLMC